MPVNLEYSAQGGLIWSARLSQILPEAIRNDSPIKGKSSLYVWKPINSCIQKREEEFTAQAQHLLLGVSPLGPSTPSFLIRFLHNFGSTRWTIIFFSRPKIVTSHVIYFGIQTMYAHLFLKVIFPSLYSGHRDLSVQFPHQQSTLPP
jgi:hypothetical protein